MASYSDFIQMQNYLPVYDITAESSNRLWASFIPTNQFCDLLQQTMTAVSSSDKFKRKSIRGFFERNFGITFNYDETEDRYNQTLEAKERYKSVWIIAILCDFADSKRLKLNFA